jgi:DNA-directed RNA polymerase specialized sigma24 family protein
MAQSVLLGRIRPAGAAVNGDQGFDEDGLLRLFDSDPVEAEDKLRQLRFRLTKFFEWRRCQSAEDLVQETILRGFRRLAAGAPLTADPVHYFFGVAQKLVLEDRRAARRAQQSSPIDEEAFPLHTLAPVETNISLRQALDRLCPEDRELVIRYHLGGRDQLLSGEAARDSAVRVKVHRILRGLCQTLTRPART